MRAVAAPAAELSRRRSTRAAAVEDAAAGPRRRRGRPIRLDIVSPGAEFEPVSPLDVPAFLRRQHEAASAPGSAAVTAAGLRSRVVE